MTVTAYGEPWLEEREARGVRSIVADRGRLRNHVFPYIGALLLPEVKSRHVRDLVRALRQAGELAPRTILNVYGLVHTMFRDALEPPADLGEVVGLDLGERLAPVRDEIGTRPSFAPVVRAGTRARPRAAAGPACRGDARRR